MAGALGSLQDNQRQSYTTVTDGASTEVAQRVKVFGLGSLLDGVSYDYIAIAYPTATTETYTYKSGGSGGTTEATITVTYVDATKAELVSVERT